MKSPFVPTVACIFLSGLVLGLLPNSHAAESEWRSLPLIAGGKVDPNWVHTGYGGFSVDEGTLRTDCDPRGLGLLVYRKEPLGNCQVRVVFRAKEAKSNSGVYIRIADGILDQVGHPGPAFDRDAKGTPSP